MAEARTALGPRMGAILPIDGARLPIGRLGRPAVGIGLHNFAGLVIGQSRRYR
jgi:hypothetical protein